MKLIDAKAIAGAKRPRCEWCRCAFAPKHTHHIFGKGAGRVDWAGNLVCLCVVCHAIHHDGNEPSKAQLLALAAEREGLLQSEIEGVVHAIRRAPKGSDAAAIIAGILRPMVGDDSRPAQAEMDADHVRRDQAHGMRQPYLAVPQKRRRKLRRKPD